MALPVSSFLDLLFAGSAPVWHQWDGDRKALIEAVEGRLMREIADAGERSSPLSHFRVMNTGLWLLDRLLPLEEREVFLPYIGKEALRNLGLNVPEPVETVPWGRAVYAWSRRLEASDRQQIFAIPVGEGNDSAICWPYQGAMIAWAETCPTDEAAYLFDWPDLREQHWTDVPHWSGNPLIGEYVARVHDARARVSEMTIALARLVARMKQSPRADYPRSSLAQEILRQILRDLAPTFSPPDGPMPRDSEAWSDWIRTELAGAAYQVLADLYERLYPRPLRHPLAAAFWVQRHDVNTWERLIHDLEVLDRLCGYAVIEHLVTIVPSDELAAWQPVLSLPQKGNYPIVALCQWLQPEFRDVLALYTTKRQPNDNVAPCAYQAYLHKTPRVVLEEFWGEHQNFPLWQLLTLDRYLFALQPVKPMPVVWDAQEVEADLRLEDPLNGRGM